MDLNKGRDGYFKKCFHVARLFTFVCRLRFDGTLTPRRKLGLGDQEIDKVMRFALKIWSAARPTPIPFSLNPDFNDKHGHRVALATQLQHSLRSTSPALPLLEAINRFDIASLSAASQMFVIHKETTAWGTIDRYVPQVDLLRAAKVTEVSPDDLKLLERTGRVITRLTEREMIAIGRHENAGATSISILWELNRWRTWIREFCEKIGKMESTPCGEELWQALSFARECIQKSGAISSAAEDLSDYAAYRKAFEKLTTRDKDDEGGVLTEDFVHIFSGCHSSPERIWKANEVRSLKFACFAVWAFTLWCGRLTIRLHRAGMSSNEAARIREILNETGVAGTDQLSRCLSVASGDIPLDFSETWLEKQPIQCDPNPQAIDQRIIADEAHWVEVMPLILTVADRVIDDFVSPAIELGSIQQS